jgi:hypothetical protein
MAVFFFLVAAIGGVVVADLVLENPNAGEASVFTQPVSGYSQGVLLALAAALGFVVALLLVASLAWTRRRRARRRQPRAVSANGHSHGTAPVQEQPGLLDEWFGRHVTLAELGQPAPPRRPGGPGGPDDGSRQHGATPAEPAPARVLPPAHQAGCPPAQPPRRLVPAQPPAATVTAALRRPSGGEDGRP